MKGDKVKVIYKLGVTGSAEHVVEATQAGRTIGIELPTRAADNYLIVKVQTRGGTVVEEHSFAKGEVIAVIDERKGRGADE